jgi:peptidoglycan/LPS O-acetylase OafA/YrhL
MHVEGSGAAPAGKFELIEVLRGAAACAVVLYHVGRHIDKATGDAFYASLTHVGHVGVDLFFVLSGFIILHVHRSDLGRPRRLRAFFVKRATRVLPMYWIALTCTVLMAGLGSQRWPGAAQWLQGWTLHPTHLEPLLGVSWTLTHEWLFYAVFGLAIWNRHCGMAALAIWTAAVLMDAGGGFGVLNWPPSVLSAYNLEFLFGMAAALWTHRQPLARPLRWMALGAALIGIGAVVEHFAVLNGQGAEARLLYGLASVLLVAGAASAPQADGLRPARWMLALGAASYSIYLFQFVFIGIVWKLISAFHLTDRLGHGTVVLALDLAAVLGGLAVWRWVERPLLARLRPHQST